MRGAIYVDGFNLYHAIDELREPHLKWCNVFKLGELVARGHAREIKKAVYCTAYFPGDHGKRARHEAYVNALGLVGVKVLLGHSTKEPTECKNCGYRRDVPREKETDINLALAIYGDAHDDVFDVAFVVTADTDQAATFRAVRARFPSKKIINVIPPGRRSSSHLVSLSDGKIQLVADHIEQCALPAMVTKENARTIVRPREYTPPDGWVHPDDRPKGKPRP